MDVWTLSCRQLAGIKPPPPPKVVSGSPSVLKCFENQCEVCGGWFIGIKTQKYCSDVCAAEARRKQDREAKRLSKPHMVVITGASFKCPDCKLVVERTSSNQLRCKPCAKVHKRKLDVMRERQRRINAREKLNASAES